MNTNVKQITLLLALGSILLSSIGCATARLPWLAKKEVTPTMDSYVTRAASNIQYDTDVASKSDYQPNVRPMASYSAPPARTASRSSGGSSGSCSSGCCK